MQLKTLSLFVFILIAGQNLRAQEAHVHGLAELNVVIEDSSLQIEFISPAANLLGFERMPNSAEEWTVLAEAIEALESLDWLLGKGFSNCDMSVEALELPSFSAEDEGHDHGGHHDKPSADAHVDFRVQYWVECPQAVQSTLEIKVFERFSGIERITMQYINGGVAGFRELTASSSVLALD